MDATLKVQGMHCNACKMIIQMGIEDAGFDEKLVSLASGDDNQGEVVLHNVSEDELAEIKNVINNVNGDHYRVVEHD